jgi:3-oxoacyl-(acyl-carrier-protein) synthase
MTQCAGRIAVLGAGVVNPVANDMAAFEQALRAARPDLSQLRDVPVPRGKATVGLVRDAGYTGPEKGLLMATAAAMEALTASGIDAPATARAGLILATMAGDSHAAENRYDELRQLLEAAADEPAPGLADAVRGYPNGILLRKLCARLRVHGPRFVVSNACASGNIAIGLALDMLRDGRCEHVIVVGVEVMKLSMLWGAERAGFVGTALRPFHPDRDGAVLGEGAAAIVLSREDAAASLGWIEGFGSVCDRGAAPITLSPDGSGLERAMQLALHDAGRAPTEIEHISAHAPGTRGIDAIECGAVARLCGDHTAQVAVNACKSITAHLSGASAVTEVIASLLQMQGGFVHGNAALDQPDPALALVPVGAQTVARTLSFGLSNACGGGGLNTSIALAAHGKPAAHATTFTPLALVLSGSAMVQDARYRWLPAGSADGELPPARLADFDVYQDYPVESNYHYMNRASQLAASAAARALRSAGIDPDRLPCADDRFGAIFGTSVGGAPQASQVLCGQLLTNPNAMTPSMSLDHGIHLGAALVCRHFGLTGTTYTITGSRRAGLQALEIAALSIHAGRADAALVAGYDAADDFETRVLAALDVAAPHGSTGQRFPAPAGRPGVNP